MSAEEEIVCNLERRLDELTIDGSDRALPIHLVYDEETGDGTLPPAQVRWLEAQNFRAEKGKLTLLPAEDGGLSGAIFGLGKRDAPDRSPLLAGGLPSQLPPGDWYFASKPGDSDLAALGWVLGAYRFDRYKADDARKMPRLIWPEDAHRAKVMRIARAVWLGRDLINTPASDLGPAELESAIRQVGSRYGADVKAIEGSDLLTENLPMIHAVGRASDRSPRLIDLVWGQPDAPKLTLIGKGVCFDTGGLNLKLGSSMALMKKDMGGAAAALAAAAMIMDAELPVRLRLLVAAVDNSVGGNAFRPGDVLTSRAGLHVEIGNTDAEGRLVLADAIALACEEEPERLVTLATLTGAARIALGPDLPALYCDDDAMAEDLRRAAERVDDPLWRMPFWAPYERMIKSKIADVNHIAQGTFAGSLIAALFLKRFAKGAKNFIHLDIYGWTPNASAAKPEGGEPQCARALYDFLERSYAR